MTDTVNIPTKYGDIVFDPAEYDETDVRTAVDLYEDASWFMFDFYGEVPTVDSAEEFTVIDSPNQDINDLYREFVEMYGSCNGWDFSGESFDPEKHADIVADELDRGFIFEHTYGKWFLSSM